MKNTKELECEIERLERSGLTVVDIVTQNSLNDRIMRLQELAFNQTSK
jgi:hypothetical protein